MFQSQKAKSLVHCIYKKEGETPLQAIQRIKQTNKATKMCYAGRLDPIASGAMLVLADDECKNKERYTHLDKRYYFEILFGVNTDTGDIVGLVDFFKPEESKRIKASQLKSVIEKFQGKYMCKYPQFSSKTVNGVPLFAQALKNKITDDILPVAEREVYKIELVNLKKIDSNTLLAQIQQRLSLLPEQTKFQKTNAFRKKEILQKWEQVLSTDAEFVLASVIADVSSGTYIRTLAKDIAKELGGAGIAYKIIRIKIGKIHKIFGKTFYLPCLCCFKL